MSTTLAIAVALLAAAPLLAVLGGPAALAQGRLTALVSGAGAVLLIIVGVGSAVGGTEAVVNLGHWLGFGHSALRVDGLSGIFLALTGVCGAATSLAFAEARQGAGTTSLAGILLLAVAVAIGADNAFLFFLAWEGLGVCIYLLASADRDDPESLFGGYFTAGLTKAGGAALLAAFALLYGHTHTFQLAAWAHAHLTSGTRGLAFLLFLVAFGSKIGLLPIQGGLPAGYSAAPGVGPASLSVALSAGFYGLWRFEIATIAPLPTWCGDLLLVVGAITAITGIVYATTQDLLRRFLGYSTVEHAGIVLGLGVALLGQSAHNRTLAAAGLLAATLHVCAHNLAKTLALIGAARVERVSGTASIDPLGGLARRLPLTAGGLGVAALTLCAIPPLGGFVSEWFTFEALLQGFRMPTLLSQLLCALAAAGLAFTAGIGLLAFAKYYGFIFLGPPRTVAAKVRIVDPLTKALGTASVAGLGIVILFLGTVAPWEIRALGSGLRGVLGFDPAAAAVTHPLVLGPVFQSFSVLAPTWLTIVLPSYAVLAALIGRQLGGRRGVRRAPVWVTGSAAELAAVQYRPSAYSNPLRVVLRGPLGFRSNIRTLPDGEHTELDTSVVLAVDRYLYQPLTRGALWASSRVRRFQSGRLSTYLLYMLIALILALALIPILH